MSELPEAEERAYEAFYEHQEELRAESVVGLLAEALHAEVAARFALVDDKGPVSTDYDYAAKILAASPALRARLAVAPDARLREALDHRTNRHLHFETTCDGCQKARALLAEPKPASPAVEGGE